MRLKLQAPNLHRAALAYATRGRKIFPCLPNSKLPATEHGFKEATCDLSQINAWWFSNPDYNIGFEPASEGLCVIEVDNYKPQFDEIAFLSLDLPETFTVRSPRGGLHLYFKGDLPPTVEKLAPAVDTRGKGGYVLLPPSIVDGKVYDVQTKANIATLPDAIKTRLTSRSDAGKSHVKEIDLAGNIITGRARISDLVKRNTIAISGHGGNNLTYQIACELVRDLGLSVETTLDLMKPWNEHCQPPWDEGELLSIIEHAANYGQNESGTYAAKPASEVFAKADLTGLPPQDQGVLASHSRFKFLSAPEMVNIKPPRWIVKDLIPENSLVLMTAKKGSFKTFLAMDLGLGIATGLDTFGTVPMQGPVFYGAHEGISLIQGIHREAWCKAHELDPAVDNGFYVGPGPRVGSDEFQPFGDAIALKLTQINRKAPKLIVLDTYSQCMLGLDENKPGDVYQFVTAAQSFITAWPGCSVLILAHTGKDESRGTRGSNSLEAAVDTVLDLTRDEGTLRARVSVRNQRGALERKTPFCFQGRTLGQSLVFDPISSMEYRETKTATDPFDRRNVAGVLRYMGVDHIEKAITSSALAATLTNQIQGESAEQFEVRKQKTERALRALARGPLNLLTTGTGKSLRWFVPASLQSPDEASVGTPPSPDQEFA